ncbi:hypothetical protein OX283_004645 [Flavobacterium sp. SUN052]|uniref:hypothetical protein n=1 Tax=Flavobacterium sp. SUN052 TaxID=3002441 RepID=UPI00237D3A0B|nr:hypothetical protein [Flavobacterium sp. SUN052]MEC4003934.1 hypothetical protein [Flavobacterium sp. SUN052]
MKKNVLKAGVIFMTLLGVVSCKDEKEATAQKTIDSYVVYVDSLQNVAIADAKADWTVIDSSYQVRTSEAEMALNDLKESEKEQARIDASKSKYETFKSKVQAEVDATQAKSEEKVSTNQLLRDRLFGAGKIGEDMSFAWVNKDNILKTYETFFQAYKDNKSGFTREDYDEIKLMYEALDSRKNTVEKEGLTSDDNAKIASIKFKFAPMFKVNRIGAKSRETEAAKE